MMELDNFECIHTIGKVRRSAQYLITDNEGQYLAKIGEQIAYRYEIVRVID